MYYSRIIGSGGYLPERVMSNAELEALVDTSDEWIQARTGIRKRHIAREDETTSEMCYYAARRAIECAGVAPDSIELIVVATSTPDLIYPSSACLLQRRLGIRNGAPAFDVQAVCSGFIYALSITDQYIRAGAMQRALVVGADMNSRILDWRDRTTCVLFGDGAGAALLERSDSPGIYKTLLHADGSYSDHLQVPSGVSKPSADPFIRMRGNEVFKFAVQAMDEIVGETLADTGLQQQDIDWLVPHQANQRIIAATVKKLGMSMDQVILTVGEHGNTSAASIPLALDAGLRDGRIKQGDIILMEAVGGGFTWGSALVRY
ncbi:MAG: ketoacyl-ACP synthase III [Gammaproteobacteria bacterium]|nr:ketoacyl-ACP synthase III [Gammaproteobacteria bacterium]MCY4211338.1 ketoacyl-ACP synthase III [Gammaproteobacteria bacterium]MCY4282082.1 ketoacyl-ACP synthase III [Gammaproteobacteria bacterium]MCY4337508.1 ketoacyl-ACP synthase III [Gammaproteobacteria bacterium]